MNKKLLLLLAVAVSAIALLAGFGPGHGFGMGKMDPKKVYRFLTFRVDSLLDDIKATDAQRTQVNTIKDDLFAEAQKLKAGHEEVHHDLMSQWDAAQVDAAKVHAAVDKQLDAVRAFAHRAADAAIRLHDLLTPEQRAQVKQHVQHAHGHGHGEPELP
jgi:periplasmic protein CpxP/Spy